MRLPLATNIKTRTGVPDKDARLKNCYVESKGPANDPNNPPQTAIRKRPCARGGAIIATGTAQGGIGINVNGVPYFFGFWSDILYPFTGSTWNSTQAYGIGQSVIYDLTTYWAVNSSATTTYPGNIGKNPSTNPTYWSTTPVSVPAHQARSAFPTGGYNWTGGIYFTPQFIPQSPVNIITLNITSTASGITTTYSSTSYQGTSPTQAQINTGTYSYNQYYQTGNGTITTITYAPVSVIGGINQNLPSSVIFDFGAVISAITAFGDALYAAQ